MAGFFCQSTKKLYGRTMYCGKKVRADGVTHTDGNPQHVSIDGEFTW